MYILPLTLSVSTPSADRVRGCTPQVLIFSNNDMKFRKKPVIIEAIRWEGNDLNLEEIAIWCDESWADESQLGKEGNIVIPTLEGRMEARVGDWIIKGVNGEFYPCKPDIFEKTYDKVE